MQKRGKKVILMLKKGQKDNKMYSYVFYRTA